MATFKISVFEHQQRRDGKYPVSIRICWKRKYAYLGTEYYVTDKQVSRKEYVSPNGKKGVLFELKDRSIINELNRRISEFEDLKAKKLGLNIEMYTARELAEYFKRETAPGTAEIDFIEFSSRYISGLVDAGRASTAKTLRTPLNAMMDYCNGRARVSITEITTKFLNGFDAFLRKERTMKRVNQFGRTVETKRKGLSDVSVHDYMTAIRILYNAAMDEYNDEDRDEIRIRHYPFRKYEFKQVPEAPKRNLQASDILAIAKAPDVMLKYWRNILSRDVFMISFYLAGTNMADLYEAEFSCYKNGRFSFERQKTRGRRKDKAFISIAVIPEAVPLFEKFRDPAGQRAFSFYTMYADRGTFVSNVDKGLKKVAEILGIDRPLSSYYARFSFATIARNDCNMSKDDVGMALNHVDQGTKITDGYIEKDWSIVDKVIRSVVDHINIPPRPVSSQSAETL